MPSRQRFQRSKSSGSKDSKDSSQSQDALEFVAKLPTPSIIRFNVSYVRKSRSSLGNNSGVLYLTATSAILYAHFINVTPDDERVVMPLKDILHVRKVSYRLLIQQGLLLRCHGLPDYLIMPKKNDIQQVKDNINAMAMEARGSTASSDAISSTGTQSTTRNGESDSDSPFVDFKDFVSLDAKDESDPALHKVKLDPPRLQIDDEILPNKTPNTIFTSSFTQIETSKPLLQEHPTEHRPVTKPKPPSIRQIKDLFFQLMKHDSAYLLIICLFLILISMGMFISLFQLRSRISSLARVIAQQ